MIAGQPGRGSAAGRRHRPDVVDNYFMKGRPVARAFLFTAFVIHCVATGEGPLLGRRVELVALRADGSEFPVELAITRILNAGPPLFTGHVRDISAAMWAALIIGLLNATIGFVLKIITFPLSILTFGLFLLIINALMILVASNIVRGFRVYGWGPAFWGAAVLALLGMLFRALVRENA